jgi:predicted Zn-dependent protease
VAKFKAKTRKLPFSVETFTITVDNVKSNSADIDLMWDNVEAYFTVTTEIDSKIMANITEAMKGEKKPYFQAASYYYENNKDLKQALSWVNEAAKAQPDAFWIYHLKAKIQMKLKDYKGAIETAEISKTKAAADKNDDYVQLNNKLIAEAKNMK